MRTDDPAQPDLAEIWAVVHAVYAGFLSGDTTAGDAGMDPEVTLWDSEAEPLVRGRSGLAALRAARPDPAPGAVAVVAVEALDPLLDVEGDAALLRHRLLVRTADGAVEHVRNTSAWRRRGGRWLMLHNHEDVVRRVGAG